MTLLPVMSGRGPSSPDFNPLDYQDLRQCWSLITISCNRSQCQLLSLKMHFTWFVCLTVSFSLSYFTTQLCFIPLLSILVVLIDVLIYSSTQLQECLINLLT